VGLDFVPNSFVGGVCGKKNAVLVVARRRFRLLASNGTPAGHDVSSWSTFNRQEPSELQLSRFAPIAGRADQFTRPGRHGEQCAGRNEQRRCQPDAWHQPPDTIALRPDGAAYLVTTRRVRDSGWFRSGFEVQS